MLRQQCKDFTSDTELADTNVDPFERQSEADFDYLTLVNCSDIDDPSQSQYRKLEDMAKEPANN